MTFIFNNYFERYFFHFCSLSAIVASIRKVLNKYLSTYDLDFVLNSIPLSDEIVLRVPGLQF